MLKFILKFGATGSTARWVAKHYLKLNSPNKTTRDIMSEILIVRYKVYNPNGAREVMKERMSYLDNLSDFTFSILQTEGAIKTKEMDTNTTLLIGIVIREELKNKGVPEKAIVDWDNII